MMRSLQDKVGTPRARSLEIEDQASSLSSVDGTPEQHRSRETTPLEVELQQQGVVSLPEVAAQLESSANELEQWLQEAEQGLARMDSERGDRQHSQHQVRIIFIFFLQNTSTLFFKSNCHL
jgi:hypothetical protein